MEEENETDRDGAGGCGTEHDGTDDRRADLDRISNFKLNLENLPYTKKDTDPIPHFRQIVGSNPYLFFLLPYLAIFLRKIR